MIEFMSSLKLVIEKVVEEPNGGVETVKSKMLDMSHYID